jgi:glycosyltransferase involved in cell wall biosynthesis
VFQPFAALQAQGYPAEWDFKDSNSPILPEIVPAFDAIILARMSWRLADKSQEVAWFRALHNAGKAVIYEVDDDMFSTGFIQRLIGLHGYTDAEAQERRDCILDTLQRCDGVTVSSQRLATIVRTFTDKPVIVVPNAIDLDWWWAVQQLAKRVTQGLTIGWAGGKRPDRDSQEMAAAWGRIARRYPQVGFAVMGHQPDVIREHVPAERITAIPWMSIEEYPLGYVNIDIGCCPLSPEPFNRAKTPIKAWEYAASGAAVVASPTVYSQVVDHADNGYICETVDEWEAALARLIDDECLRRQMARRMLGAVKARHSLRGNLWRWPTAWAEIVAHFRAHRPVLVPVGARVLRPVHNGAAAGG